LTQGTGAWLAGAEGLPMGGEGLIRA
jgi:hypothetical protein